MSAPPFMQLYVGDYLADTTDLTAEQHGAYLLILMTMWRHGAKLPNDHTKLARIARLSPRRWRGVWGEIGRFFTDDGTYIHNKRQTEEYQKAAEKSAVRAASGRKGGLAKPLKSKEPPQANASDLLKHGQISEPDIKREGSNEPLSERRSADPVPADEVSAAFIAWNAAAERNGWPKVQKLNPSRRKALTARLREVDGVTGWEHALARAEASDFLCGRTSNPWTAFAFDWLVKPANFTKLMEGNYDNRTDRQAGRGHQLPAGAAPRANAESDRIAEYARLRAARRAAGGGH